MIGSVSGLPNQFQGLVDKLSEDNENPSKFARECMDFFDGASGAQLDEKRKIWKNYQLYSGTYDYQDYEYVTKPFEEDFGELPSQLRHYPIISPPIKTLWGEMNGMPFNYFCKAEDQHSMNEFNRTKTDLLQKYVMQQLTTELTNKGIPIQSQDQVQQMMPHEIETYMTRKFTPTVEQWASYTLKYEVKKQSIKEKTMTGFLDGLIAGYEFYMSYNFNGRSTSFDVLNPMYTFYDKGTDVEFIDEGDYAGFRLPMTSSQIMDMWGKDLSENQINKLFNTFSNSKFGRTITGTGPDTIQFDTTDRNTYYFDMLGVNGEWTMDSLFSPSSNNFVVERIPVVMVFWKSKRKIGYLHFYDQMGIEQMTIVDEFYKENKKRGEWIEWDFVNQVWEGTKIGSDIYINVRPCSYQGVSINNVTQCKLPITGIAYNARNSRATSLLDEMKQYQEAFNIYMYKLEQDFNSEIGKVLLMSLRHIPNRKGWDEKKWLWYLKAMKIAWVDDSLENMKGQTSGFNQMSAIDASLGDEIASKIKVLEWLKSECNYLAGITPQRLGETQSSETLGGVERSIRQSVAQSEIWFQNHIRVVQRALTNHLNVCQKAYSEGKQLYLTLDDMSKAFVDIDGGVFELADLGVFVTNMSEDQRVLQALRSLAQPAMQSGADLADIAELETTDSITELKDQLQRMKQERIQREQQKQQIEQQKIQSAQQMLQHQIDNENMNKQLDRENAVRIALINHADASQEEATEPTDSASSTDMYKLQLDASKLAYEQALGLRKESREDKKLQLEQQKVNNEKAKANEELKLKEKELVIKNKVASRPNKK